jgi:hypothetical protein
MSVRGLWNQTSHGTIRATYQAVEQRHIELYILPY